jgi:hypothetical protein
MKFRFLLTSLIVLLTVGCAHLLERPSLEHYQSYFAPLPKTRPVFQPGQVHVTYMGTTSLLFSDGHTSILIDGFFTRPGPPLGLPFRKIETNRYRVRNYLKRLGVQKLDAIFVFHSHYDHAMDAPYIALQTGAQVVGSKSTAYLSKGEGLTWQQIVVTQPYKTLQYGDFKVTMIPSRHTDLPWVANLTGMMGDIDAPLAQPMSMFDYREGETYTIHIAHPKGIAMLHGSHFIPGELKGWKADEVFLCTPGLERLATQQEAFYQEVIGQTGAKTIYPVHWDDFTISLDKPLVPLPRGAEDLDTAMDFILSHTQKEPGMRVQFLRAFEQIGLFGAQAQK